METTCSSLSRTVVTVEPSGYLTTVVVSPEEEVLELPLPALELAAVALGVFVAPVEELPELALAMASDTATTPSILMIMAPSQKRP